MSKPRKTRKKRSPQMSRGVPIAEYHRIRRRIKIGELKSWEEAVESGYCLEAGKRGRRPKPLRVMKPI
jgi:hypothetical protein